MKNKELTVSVMVATYNPQESALAMTLRSILAQKNCKYEIVITDDGSVDNKFEFIRSFFANNRFHDYKFVANVENEGTVKNAINGVRHCDGLFIKPISPGDCLYGEYVLANWCKNIKMANAVLSFADTVDYIHGDGGSIEIKSFNAFPYDVNAYKIGGEKLRESYLLKDNKCIGASTLIKKNVFEYYLNIIDNKVIYCEDAVYRLMLYNREPTIWFNDTAVLYEYGNGVSTRGDDEWNRIIRRDWIETNKILESWLNRNEKFDKKLLALIKAYDDEVVNFGSKYRYYIRNIGFAYERILYKLKIKKIRMTPVDEKKEFIEIIKGKGELC